MGWFQYPSERESGRRILTDLAVIVLVVAAVVGVSASAPTHIYAYAQPWNIGAGLSMLQTGDWLLPRLQIGQIARKPPLFPWLVAGAVALTGAREEIVFYLPSILASLGTAVVVYVIALRWYGRAVALLAAVLWATLSHMHKLMYLATTDMLLAFWIAVCILCADLVLFHPARRRGGRRLAVVGFWAAMILAALTKGWGVVNFPLVGGMIALAVAVRPGFRALARAGGTTGKLGLLLRLLLRRWRRALRVIRLGWGILAFLAVMVPLLAAMVFQGGWDFLRTWYFEVFQRFTGQGPSPPAAIGAPPVLRNFYPVLHLLYYTFPASLFAICGLLLVRRGRWFVRRSRLSLPLCWILAVVVPFCLSHGFRPDYLLPCYPAVAMLGAWAVQALHVRGRARSSLESVLRHIIAGGVLVIGGGVVVASALYLLGGLALPGLRERLRMPPELDVVTVAGVIVSTLIGAGVCAVAVRASLRWRLRRLAGASVVGMLAMFFLYTHVGSRHASGDGREMVAFAHDVRAVVRDDRYAVYRAAKLCTELFLPRFGRRITSADPLRQMDVRWLVTCDLGLRELPGSDARAGQKGYRAEQLGRVRCSSAPIETDRDYGRAYLIELRQAVPTSGPQPSRPRRRRGGFSRSAVGYPSGARSIRPTVPDAGE